MTTFPPLTDLDFEVLPPSQYIPIVVLNCTSSFLSILGSACVLFMSYRELHKIMHRFMFALSLSDLMASTACLFMPFSVPSHLGLAGGVGNHASCAATGFFLMMCISVGCAYNAGLSGYFGLVVCRNWKEQDFQRRPEILCHVIAWGIPLALNIAAVATQSINPSPLINNLCVYATYPWTCNENEDLDCTRGTETATTLIVAVGGLWLLVFTIAGFVGTFLVWNNVRTTFRRSSAYRFQGDQQPSRTDQRILQVRTQAILYSLVYFNTIFWPALATAFSNQSIHTAIEIQQIKTQTGYYIFQLLYFTFYPLQGFLNFFVYTRLRVQRRRKEDPDANLVQIYQQVIFSSRTSSHMDSTHKRQSRQSRNKQQLQNPVTTNQAKDDTGAAVNPQQEPATESHSATSFTNG